MPKGYSKVIFSILLAILVINVAYFFYTAPKSLQDIALQVTQYQSQPVEGAIQPLPLIKEINTAWVMLGKALFHSPLLSVDNTISCASCHIMSSGGDDGFPVSTGVDSKVGSRNSPTVLNAVLSFRQFWDGRGLSIAEQAVGPIHNPVEMNSNFEQIINKLKKEPTFNRMFHKLDKRGVTEENIIKAIVTYEESLITSNSPIDKYLLGDNAALSVQQIRGLEKFKQYGCVTCHQGRNIGGNLFQKIGRIDEAPKHLLEDKGRYNVTLKESDLHVYKVPSLRNIALTAPYFHNGSIHSLHDAVKLMGRMQLGIDLSEEDVDDLVALLNAFTGEVKEWGK